MIITVSWGGGCDLKGSFTVYVSVVDIPIIFACQVTDSWRHKSDLWRHRCDTALSMSTIRPKYSTEMHQNISFFAKLNGEHAGEGFMPLGSIFLEIRTRELEKSRNFRKFDFWPAITGSNIDLGPKIIPPIVSTRREKSAGLFREALRCFVWKRQGRGSHQPSPTEGGETPYPGEGKDTSQFPKYCPTQVLFICFALSRDLRMCHCGQGTSRIFGPKAISPAVLSQWENGALLFASILTT